MPCALLISFVIWEVRWVLAEGLGTALNFALPTALFGLASFPLGLAFPWLAPQGALRIAWPWVSLAGYVLYVALSLVAWKRSSLKVGIVLVLLLLANVISCQVQGPAIQRTIGFE